MQTMENKAALTNGALVAEAMRLVRRPQTVLVPAEVEVMIAAAERLEAEADRPLTRDEMRVLEAGRRLRSYHPLRGKRERKPTPFDAALDVARGRLAEEDAALDAARAEFHAALDEVSAAGRDKPKNKADEARVWARRERAERRLVEAREKLQDADRVWLRARARVTALDVVRSRWLADREEKYWRCTCTWCQGEPEGDSRPADCLKFGGR